MRDVFERFAQYLSKYTYPTLAITVEEMLVAYRGYKCSFIVYIKDKLDRYGIKFWVLTDMPMNDLFITFNHTRVY